MAPATDLPKSVGTALFTPGALTRGELVLTEHIDGPVTTPVMIATGAKPGPVLWVQGAIHGGEIGGPLAIARCLAGLDTEAMSGAIVGVLTANPLAFGAQTRNMPQDGENMNRVFPGTVQGTITRQMAATLLAAAESVADTVIDCHSGGVEAIVPFYALYWDDASEASKLSAQYARSAGTDIIWKARDGWLSGGMFSNLVKRGLPSVIIECGGGGAMPDEHIDAFASSITGIARCMSILPGGPVRQPRYTVIGACDLVYSQEGGFFLPDCAAGDRLAAGARVGTIIDAFGTVKEVITAPKRAFVAAVARRYLPVHSGSFIAELNDDLGWENGSD